MKIRMFGYVPDNKPKKWNKKATFVMKGKKIVIQDYINENATGLNFYENLERLGSVESTIKYMRRNGEEIYGDFSKAITLENLEQQRNALMNVWNQLPYTEREKFGYSFEEFMTNGKEYMESLRNEFIKEYTNGQNVNNTEPIPEDKGKENIGAE